MTTFNERVWERHSHPWSGWIEVLLYPLVYVPVWNRSRRQGFAVAALFAVDIVGFPPPQDNSAWMTRAMLGEQHWMKQPPRDWSMVIVGMQTLSALVTFSMAFQRRLSPLLWFSSSALLLKMCFLRGMAASYAQLPMADKE